MMIRQMTYGGIPLHKLADTGFKAFQHGMQVLEPSPLDGSGGENLFTGAAVMAMNIIDKHEDDASVVTTTFQDLARDCFMAGCQAAGELETWESLTDAEKLSWQAVVRHWSNILESEDGINKMEDWEPMWREWVTRKLAPVNAGTCGV